MPLPEFNDNGDLPEGVYQATLDEVLARFGHDTPQRQLVTARLARIYKIALSTGKLLRFVIFGSYVTAVFWTRPGTVLLETVDEFIGYWQIKRDLTRRGIVEVISEVAK
jgi:hypothetical protein